MKFVTRGIVNKIQNRKAQWGEFADVFQQPQQSSPPLTPTFGPLQTEVLWSREKKITTMQDPKLRRFAPSTTQAKGGRCTFFGAEGEAGAYLTERNFRKWSRCWPSGGVTESCSVSFLCQKSGQWEGGERENRALVQKQRMLPLESKRIQNGPTVLLLDLQEPLLSLFPSGISVHTTVRLQSPVYLYYVSLVILLLGFSQSF